MEMKSLIERLTSLENQSLTEGAKPDFLDMDKDGNKKEPMKKAVADKKKPASDKIKKESRGSIAEALMKDMGYDLDEEKVWDRVIRKMQTPTKPPNLPINSLTASDANPEAELDPTIAATRAGQAPAPEVPAYMPGDTPTPAPKPPAPTPTPVPAKPGVDTGMTDRNPYEDDAFAQSTADRTRAEIERAEAEANKPKPPGPAPTPAPAPAPAPLPYNVNPETGKTYDPGVFGPLPLPPGAKPEAGRPDAGQPTTPSVTTQKTKPVFDPKVQALQQQLIAKGAKIKADGFMGDQTRTAMKQFGTGGPVATQPKATGSAALAPVGTTNAATAIPTGGLDNQANQAKKPAPTSGPKGEPLVADPKTGKMGYWASNGRSRNFVPVAEGKEDAELTAMLRIAGLR
jgi:hypothetical protein